jgi:nucleotide-binding universal stress UspA family protein
MGTPQVTQGISLKNILLATDFSQFSEYALRYAVGIARSHGSKVYAVHVVSPEKPAALYPEPALPQRTHAETEREMKNFVGWEPLAQIPHEVLLEEGSIWNVIYRIIRERDIDLLVLGTHGRGGIRKIVLGSAAEELFRLAWCPVLTIGPAVTPATEVAATFRHILFATDFGAASLRALPYAISLATENQADLTLLHVLPGVTGFDISPYWRAAEDVIEQHEKARAASVEQLQRLLPPESKLGGRVQALVEFGPAADRILKTAAERQADLIVMGVNWTASVRASAHLPWAIAHEVVCHAKCPVLTVRAEFRFSLD